MQQYSLVKCTPNFYRVNIQGVNQNFLVGVFHMLSGKAFQFKTAHNSLPPEHRERKCVLLCYMYTNFVPKRKKKIVCLHKVILLKRIKKPHQLVSLSPIFEHPSVKMLPIVIFNSYVFCNIFTS